MHVQCIIYIYIYQVLSSMMGISSWVLFGHLQSSHSVVSTRVWATSCVDHLSIVRIRVIVRMSNVICWSSVCCQDTSMRNVMCWSFVCCHDSSMYNVICWSSTCCLSTSKCNVICWLSVCCQDTSMCTFLCCSFMCCRQRESIYLTNGEPGDTHNRRGVESQA